MGLTRTLLACAIMLTSILSYAAEASAPVSDSPWFAGTLLAKEAQAVPRGHINIEPYLFYTDDFGHYNSRWHRASNLEASSLNPTLYVNIGFLEWADVAISVPYFLNSTGGRSGRGFGDIGVDLNFQVLEDAADGWQPDLLLYVSELFPTGTFDELDPGRNGADSTGVGSYQTGLGAVLQKVWTLPNRRYLRTRLTLSYVVPSKVDLRGFNSFGGAANTDGSLDLGNQFTTVLSFEYSLTRNWVPALDLMYTHSASNDFSGFPGTTGGGAPADIFTSSSTQISAVPTIEYNFSENVAVVLGVWFSVAGRNSDEFISTIAAFNYHH